MSSYERATGAISDKIGTTGSSSSSLGEVGTIGSLVSSSSFSESSDDCLRCSLILTLCQIHQNQMEHVRKGCLARPLEDFPMDGSRIESSHKGWNSLQRTFSCGIVLFSMLAHDHVLRRNIRIASKKENTSPGSFVASLHGSHHIFLFDHIAAAWNSHRKSYIEHHQSGANKSAAEFECAAELPRLKFVASDERFGLVDSASAQNLNELFKQEDEFESEEGVSLNDETSSGSGWATDDELFEQMNISDELRHIPLKLPPSSHSKTQDLVFTGTDATRTTASATDPIIVEDCDLVPALNFDGAVDVIRDCQDDALTLISSVVKQDEHQDEVEIVVSTYNFLRSHL